MADEGMAFQRRSCSESEPFSRPQDSGPTNALVVKLNWIGDSMLREADPPLYQHLEALEIAPQIYGM